MKKFRNCTFVFIVIVISAFLYRADTTYAQTANSMTLDGEFYYTPEKADGYRLNYNIVRLVVNDSIQLRVLNQDFSYSNIGVTWVFSSPSYEEDMVFVDNEGTIYANKPGIVYAYALLDNGGLLECEVEIVESYYSDSWNNSSDIDASTDNSNIPSDKTLTEEKAPSIVKDAKPSLNVQSLTMYTGEKFRLILDNSDGPIKYKSSKKSIVEVASDGTVKAKKEGKAVISVKNDGHTYKCTVVVKKGTLTFSDKTTQFQKIWEYGTNYSYRYVYDLIRENKEGSTYTFLNRNEYERTREYLYFLTGNYDAFHINTVEWKKGKCTLTIHKNKKNKKLIESNYRIKKLKQAYDALGEAGVTENMDVYTAYKKIEAFILKKASYDYSLSNHDFYCILDEGKGVCQAYAQLTQLMCIMAGIDARYCESEEHAWNKIYIHGKWYYTDLTWGDIVGDKYLYKTTLWDDYDHELKQTLTLEDWGLCVYWLNC